MPRMKDLEQLPGAGYGPVTKEDEEYDPATDTSPLPEPDGMDDDDDELQETTDPALVEMLGFDPLDWENEDEDEDTVRNEDGTVSKRQRS